MTAKRLTTKPVRVEFLEAWHRHDDAALAMSASPNRPNEHTLERETKRYIAAQARLGAQLDMPAHHVVHIVVALRQLQWERDDCIAAVEAIAAERLARKS